MEKSLNILRNLMCNSFRIPWRNSWSNPRKNAERITGSFTKDIPGVIIERMSCEIPRGAPAGISERIHGGITWGSHREISEWIFRCIILCKNIWTKYGRNSWNISLYMSWNNHVRNPTRHPWRNSRKRNQKLHGNHLKMQTNSGTPMKIRLTLTKIANYST